MGVLNVTPDSYSDGGKYFELQSAINHGLKLANDGADIIDIGGCSTRPYSTPPPIEEEVRRIEFVIKTLRKKLSIPISIDTYRPEVAQIALEAGANIINDVTGFTDKKMRALAKQYNADICIVHMQKDPATMQINPSYPNGVVPEIMTFLKKQIELCMQEGISQNQIYLDPGICLGKSLDDNFEILHNLEKFRELNFPLLVGISKKSFLYKTLRISPQECLLATIAVNSCIYPFVDIFRVHDVKEHVQMSVLIDKVKLKPQKDKEVDGDCAHIHSDH
ncbi:MAG: Dihydropteroate synthase [Chlamydiae bacterium]|nr:Dihydropteroate synthase [Chlamydiota bacterium]